MHKFLSKSTQISSLLKTQSNDLLKIKIIYALNQMHYKEATPEPSSWVNQNINSHVHKKEGITIELAKKWGNR